MSFYLKLFLLLFNFQAYAFDGHYLEGISKDLKLEFAPFFTKNFLINNEKNRLSNSANLRLSKLGKLNLKQAKEVSKLQINLISWPSEDKLIYKIGEQILKDGR